MITNINPNEVTFTFNVQLNFDVEGVRHKEWRNENLRNHETFPETHFKLDELI